MQTLHVLRRRLRSLYREERGVIMAMVLVLMTLLMGVGATAIYSGYANLQTSTNLKLASRAKAQAETNINEAIYRLSRQETDADAIIPDLTSATWQVEIDFTSGDTSAADGTLSTIQASTEWPDHVPDDPVIVRFKRPDATGNPNGVLFYDPQQSPSFVTYTLPNANIPYSAHPVLQIVATAQDERGAERQILAEVAQTTSFSPPAPLSSGVDVFLNGSGFIDGVNHDHRIYISNTNGVNSMYGDTSSETTATPISGSMKDSGDDRVKTSTNPYEFFLTTYQAYAGNGNGNGGGSGGSGGGGSGSSGSNCDTGVGNPSLNNGMTTTQLQSLSPALQRSCARLYNKQISATNMTPAWVGLRWIDHINSIVYPSGSGYAYTTERQQCVLYGHSLTIPHWHGANTGYASAIALSNNGVGGPTVVNDGQPPVSGVWDKGVFTWGANNGTTDLTNSVPAAGTITDCSPNSTPSLVCRPAPLSHSADSFYSGPHFPYFQEFLGLDDTSFHNLLDHPDRDKTDLNNGLAPHGFTYIEGNYIFNNSTAAPATDDFVLIYVTGNLTINGNQRLKGLVFIDGSLSINGTPVILGAVMVRGTTQITATTGNMTLLYSRRAAELGIQAGHPWRIMSWADTAMQ
jgi:hypothetical protein